MHLPSINVVDLCCKIRTPQLHIVKWHNSLLLYELVFNTNPLDCVCHWSKIKEQLNLNAYFGEFQEFFNRDPSTPIFPIFPKYFIGILKNPYI